MPGKFGTALSFDGVTDRVTVPADASLQPDHVSLAMWFRAASRPGGWRVLAFKGVADCVASSYSLKSDSNGSGLVFMAFDVNAGNVYTKSATGIWDGKWHHAVGTYDGAALRLYVDGGLVDSRQMKGPIRYGWPNGDDFVIGHPVNLCGQLTQFEGLIDDVRIWDRALSAKEVARLANPTTGKKPKR